jgi:hypothetical protein
MHLQFSFWYKVKKMAQQVMTTASSFHHFTYKLSTLVKVNELNMHNDNSFDWCMTLY